MRAARRKFLPLEVKGLNSTPVVVRPPSFDRKYVPRFNFMRPTQNWTNVWPTAKTFLYSAVPLPLHQGYAKNSAENEGVTPGKYANAELMKIPNFLHLTPNHINTYCGALKKFCTAWPSSVLSSEEDMRQHFPIEVTTRDYITVGPSIRDPRSRLVTIRIPVSALKLDDRARQKFIDLMGKEKYNSTTDEITLSSERCPIKKQNRDFLFFILQVVYAEAKKKEAWEENISHQDWHHFHWESSVAKSHLENFIRDKQKAMSEKPRVVRPEAVEEYRKSLGQLIDNGENKDSLRVYADSVLQLYFPSRKE